MLLPTIVILIIIVRRVIQFHPTGRSRWKGLQWVLSDATDDVGEIRSRSDLSLVNHLLYWVLAFYPLLWRITPTVTKSRLYDKNSGCWVCRPQINSLLLSGHRML